MKDFNLIASVSFGSGFLILVAVAIWLFFTNFFIFSMALLGYILHFVGILTNCLLIDVGDADSKNAWGD